MSSVQQETFDSDIHQEQFKLEKLANVRQVNLILCTPNWITVGNVCMYSDFTEGFILILGPKSCSATQLAEVKTEHSNGRRKGI